jgi:long-chain acyl-CoA synthetase
LQDGWFHTGDQGEVDDAGNWRIIGRLKDLIILNAGHNIAPEPIENTLLKELPGAQQVMLVGNNRSFLVALINCSAGGAVSREAVEAALAKINLGLPHYKQVRNFHAGEGMFTLENGLLTANGKLKRAWITTRFSDVIEELYRKPHA